MKELSISAALLMLSVTLPAQSIFFVGQGAIVHSTGSAIITLDNVDLVCNGVIDQQPGEGVFRFSGNTSTTIGGDNLAQFAIMQMAKSAGANLSLNQNIKISEQLVFESGLFDLKQFGVSMEATGLLINESETSRITATQGGYVTIANILNTPLSANPGNLGALITTSQNLGNTIVRRGHLSQMNGNGNGSSILRYYDIIPENNTGLNATLRLRYFDAELNSLTENALTLWKSSDNTHWINMNYAAIDAASNYLEQNGLADFSRWTLSTVNNALPVRFLLFNVSCNDNNTVSIVWKTAQEQNSASFAVQKSNDGVHFVTIGAVQAAGNSSIGKTYYYTDNTSSPNVAFYRIAEIDIDGRMQYTAINRMQCGSSMDELKVWPNPVQQTLFANVNVSSSSPVTIKIFDSKGVFVQMQNATLLRGSNIMSINMGNFAAGNYHITLDWNKGQYHKAVKIVKQ